MKAVLTIAFMKDTVLKRVFDVVSPTELARRLGIQRQAIYQWRRVPVARVLEVEQHTKIPRHELRPDFYPKERRVAC